MQPVMQAVLTERVYIATAVPTTLKLSIILSTYKQVTIASCFRLLPKMLMTEVFSGGIVPDILC
jgi:hypothetical protein